MAAGRGPTVRSTVPAGGATAHDRPEEYHSGHRPVRGHPVRLEYLLHRLFPAPGRAGSDPPGRARPAEAGNHAAGLARIGHRTARRRARRNPGPAEPRGSPRRCAARVDRIAPPDRIDRPDRRTHRRPDPPRLPQDRQPRQREHRAASPERNATPVLQRVRLARARRQDTGPQESVAGQPRHAGAGTAGDAQLG